MKNGISAKTFEVEIFLLTKLCSHMEITIEKLQNKTTYYLTWDRCELQQKVEPRLIWCCTVIETAKAALIGIGGVYLNKGGR